MPIPAQISKFLEAQHVNYESCRHSPAYTAQGVAQAQHVSGRRIAKVVMVKADDRLVMAVVPASCRVDLERLGACLQSGRIRLATEEEFQSAFPDCELGAMPPLGNIYHLEVWIDRALRAQPILSFNAGTHSDTIQMSCADFERLVQPNAASFAVLLH